MTADPTTGTAAPIRIPGLAARRVAFFGLVLLTTLTGTWMMLGIVVNGGITALEALILMLFVPTFAWITLPFWTSVVGFVLQLLRIDPLTLARRRSVSTDPRTVRSRTAVVMPVYNEDIDRVLQRFGSTLASTVATGQASRFDFFLLSDTTDPVLARAESAAWEAFVAGVSAPGRLVYRRRPTNTSQKSGNIRDFCERWGDDYPFMVVLDADSTMTGDTLVALVHAMEDDPRVGLIQTTPLPTGQRTLFGRLLQFGAHLASPVLSAGQSFWQADAANYWGHNAIVRLAPFRELADLPVLPGRPPLGGEILSHDFVEAALLRRGGWRVLHLSDLGGSYEEVPPTLPEYARRDRRWAQGSLQHLRLLTMRDLHPLSRLHFLTGAMGYLSSVLWCGLLLAGSAYVLSAELSPGGTAPTSDALREMLAAVGPSSVPLLALTAGILFLPKILGLVLAMIREPSRFGGRIRVAASALIELVFGVILAPLLMVTHVRTVLAILAGRTVRWATGERDASGLSWSDAWREGRFATLAGLVWGAATGFVSWEFLGWLSPILVGLVLAVPLVRWTASRRLGDALRSLGLLRVGVSEPSTGRPGSAPATSDTDSVRPAVNW